MTGKSHLLVNRRKANRKASALSFLVSFKCTALVEADVRFVLPLLPLLSCDCVLRVNRTSEINVCMGKRGNRRKHVVLVTQLLLVVGMTDPQVSCKSRIVAQPS